MNKRKIGVIGLGYVGLPLAVALRKSGFDITGFDVNRTRIEQLKANNDVTEEVSATDLEQYNIHFSADESVLSTVDFYIVTVPTPIDEANKPDLGMVYAATRTVGKYLKKNDVVVYESTVYPGVTEDECVPILEKVSGLTYLCDFGVGYSPERINPGDKKHRIEDIKKVVSGSDPQTLRIVSDVYGQTITAGIFEAKNIKTAEAAKVIENIQRDLNIALINELSIIFNKLGINTYDVLNAAATKWNFSRYEPGLVGGHCIGVDPYYLTYCAEKLGYNPEVILSGRRINNRMSEVVVTHIIKNLAKMGKAISGSRVTILGFTFKENVPDIRNTKIIDIVKGLEEYNIKVDVCDPIADAQEVFHEYGINLVPYNNLQSSDAVILSVKHHMFVDKGWGVLDFCKKGQGFLLADLKNTLQREEKPDYVTLWSL